MSYADVDGLALWYDERGSGDPLVLLHGGIGGSEMFDPILDTLAAGRRGSRTSPPTCCWFSPTPIRSARCTSWSSSACSAAACPTRAGTASRDRLSWPSCLVTPTM